MNKLSPLTKRIKRHITGTLQNFFIVTLPGFENLCKKELASLLLNISSIKTKEGGVEFTGKLNDCYLANMHLRTANRILMRITEFNVTNFRKLEKKVNEIPWELYLKEGCIPMITVTTKHSRLYHSDAISERILGNINERKKTTYFFVEDNQNIQLQNIQNIFIRLIEDHMVISIDSSGDLLFKRGIKRHTGNAPIRETLAAAALLKAGYTGDEPLFDPMCGTGTFSIEAATIVRHIPPGWYRQFAFEAWPGFKPAQWAYLKRQTEKKIKVTNDNPSIVASDKDKKACDVLLDTLKKYNLDNFIRVLNDDFFNFTPDDIYKITGYKRPGLVIINPPYGIRLGNQKGSRKLFIKIIDRLAEFFFGWKFALFTPEKDIIERCGLKGEQVLIDHGGIKLILFTGVIPKRN